MEYSSSSTFCCANHCPRLPVRAPKPACTRHGHTNKNRAHFPQTPERNRWIGVIVAVVMSLVPRKVRVTTLALYNFIITNISGLATTLVPLLRKYYAASHIYRFFAEPRASATGAAAAAIAAANADGRHYGTGDLASGSGFLLRSDDVVGLVSGATAAGYGGLGSGGAGGDGLGDAFGVREGVEDGGVVEFEVPMTGSRGLQAAMFWMYPGMYLASSGEWCVKRYFLGLCGGRGCMLRSYWCCIDYVEVTASG